MKLKAKKVELVICYHLSIAQHFESNPLIKDAETKTVEVSFPIETDLNVINELFGL